MTPDQQKAIVERFDKMFKTNPTEEEFDAFLLSEIETAVKERDDLLEMAWGIIANAGGGNWEEEKEEWRAAASRFRDKWLGPITGSV